MSRRRITVSSLSLTFLVALALVLGGCYATPPAPGAADAEPPPPAAVQGAAPKVTVKTSPPNTTDVSVGEQIAISVETTGANLEIEWRSNRGVVSPGEGPSTVYTAPDTAGVDTVDVIVTSDGGTTTRTVVFNVVAGQAEPGATDASGPAAARPASTVIPPSTPLPPTPTSTLIPLADAVVNAQVLNVRSGPSTNYPIIGGVEFGDKLTVTGKNEDSSWLEITTEGIAAGWVAAGLVRMNINLNAVPVAEAPPPPSTGRSGRPLPLKVTFTDFHYECRKHCLKQPVPPVHPLVWGYRNFQVLMVVENVSADRTLQPPWQPTRWIITDGQTERVDTFSWQWLKRDYGDYRTYKQPPIPPGGRGEWTWVVFPLRVGEWVKAIEFDKWGHTYRQEMPPPSRSNNYEDCGGPTHGSCG